MEKKRPFLKWAGNKYQCLEHILTALPQSNRLIEPFTGSGAIFMNSNYSNYLLAEQNADLTHLYQLVKQKGSIFVDYCAHYFTGQYNNEADFYQFRDLFNQSKHGKLRAALFLYLNRHGYNGLCRYNQSGLYNVPFGRYIKPYFPQKEMLAFHHKSQQAVFLQADFRKTFLQAIPGDVIYCDPPYVPLSHSANFQAYTARTFNEADQIALAELATITANRGIPVIISNHDTEFTRHYYQFAKIISFDVKRSISCKGKQRLPVTELVAIFE
jgi:DNA adenine methylase